ncbi:MAG: TMEM165/GDT1 family protein [Tissierellia bacterium]|nr:TMEM165/GDT1 family protein [Tissierellia bacterium]
MNEFIQSFILIFLAEMGDKSQLMALAFAATYPFILVLTGISLGIALNHGVAVLFAYFIASNFGDMTGIHFFAALLFLYFGFKSFEIEFEEDEEEKTWGSFGPLVTMAGTFFVAELGDKTQLTAMTLALESSRPWIIYLATVSSMISVSLIGIIVGKFVGKRIPERTLGFLAGCLFLYFGWSKLEGVLPLEIGPLFYWLLALAISLLLGGLVISRSNKKAQAHYSQALSEAYAQCRACAVHKTTCPVCIRIEDLTRAYLGEDLPYLGSVIKHIEDMGKVDHKKADAALENFKRSKKES